MFSLNAYTDLYIVFVLLYLWESLIVVRPHELLFWTGAIGLWRALQYRSPDTLYEFARGSVMATNLLPWTARAYSASLPVFTPCSEGIVVAPLITLARRRRRKAVSFVPWSEAESVRFVDGKVVWNAMTLLSGLRPEAMRGLQREWGALLRMGGSATAWAKRLAFQLDAQEQGRIRGKEQMLRKCLRWLNAHSMLYFLFLFVALPVVGLRFSIALLLPEVLLLLFLFMTVQTVLYLLAVRRLGLPGMEYRWQAVLVFFAPPYALRSAQRLAVAYMADEAAPTLGLALLTGRERTLFLSAMLRDLRHPMHIEDPNAADEALAEGRRTWLSLLDGWEDYLVDSRPETTDEAWICPRCLQAYTEGVEECADCQVRLG